MALAAAMVWEIRTAGSDTACSGGFKAGATGTDYSQQDAAQKSGVDLAIDAVDNTKVQPVAAGVAATDIGNTVIITAGTGFTVGTYEITAQDGTYWTLDRAAGTTGSTAGTYAMGGACASPGKVAGLLVAGNTVHVKSGTYTMSATGNVAAGRINLDIINSTWIGYGTTRQDSGTKPVLAAGANTMTPVTLARADYWFENFEIHATGRTACTGMVLGGSSGAGDCWVYRCKVHTCQSNGIADAAASTVHILGCEVTGITGGTAAIALTQSNPSSIIGCYVHDNTVTGVVVTNANRVCYTISETNTGSTSIHGFNANGNSPSFVGCVAYGNAGHGFASVGVSQMFNCIAEAQTGATRIGFDNAAGGGLMLTCGVYNNTTNVGVTTGKNVVGTITGTGTFFTSAATGNFDLNNTVGGGAGLQSTGFPVTIPGVTGTAPGPPVGARGVVAATGQLKHSAGRRSM